MRLEIEKAGTIWVAGKAKEETKIKYTLKQLSDALCEEFIILMDESDEDGIDLSIGYDSQFTTIEKVKSEYIKIKRSA